MADEDPTELVTIQYPHTGETREVPRGAVPGFTDESGWVVLDAAGRKKAHQPTPASTSAKEL